MSERVTGELHRLYRDYYAGRLALADYRHQRGLLLDSLLGGAPEADEMQTMPRQQLPELNLEQSTSEPVRAPKPRGFRWPYVVAACIPLLAVIVFLVTKELGEPLQTEIEPDPAAGSAAAVIEEPVERAEPQQALEPEIPSIPDVGQVLVEQFIARDDWRDVRLKEFQDTWGRLPARDRIVAKGSMWFAPLVDGLEYQINEAIEFSSNPDEDPRLTSLYLFASKLGLPELAPSGWRPPKPKPVVRNAPGAAVETPVAAKVVEPPAVETETAPPVKTRPDNNEYRCRASQLETRRRTCHDVLEDGSNGPPMLVVASGSLDEQRVVRAPFAISLREVSRQEFEVYCKGAAVSCPDNPWPGEDMPVVNVSWEEAAAYSAWLSEQTGYRYRLPSETEWEYAARAGSDAEYPYGDELTPAMARYSGLADYDKPLSIDDTTTRRNKFGLWHVVGNVREWVAPDGGVDSDERTARGGSYADSEDGLRLTDREILAASDRDRQTGFRILREL